MKLKTKILITATAGLAILGGFIYYKMNDKQAYDYKDYYVESPSSDQTKDNDEAPEMVLSLSQLQQTNPDVVGILEFDNKEIYEPVVQAPNNDYYVRRNLDRHYAAAGIPFVSGDGNIQSKNVVIYGHSSAYDNIIFTPLMQYLNKDYYNNHPSFQFETNDEIRKYQIFSVMSFDTKNLNDSQEFMQTSWRKVSDLEQFIKNIQKKSIYQTNISVNKDDDLMTLVTCDNTDNSKRVVVIAKLVKE